MSSKAGSDLDSPRQEEPITDKKGVRTEIQTVADDEELLARLGYKQEFAREFTNISTISFAFSIMGLSSSLVTTFSTPLFSGGPAAVVWCWLIGSCFCFCLGVSIAELVSAYPTNGGLYSASAYLVPRKYRAITGWIVGWLNILGQIAGVASTAFGLSQMIFAAVVLSKDGNFTPTAGMYVGLTAGILCLAGLINSVGTKMLAQITQTFVFINLGSVLGISIALLVCTKDKHSASYVFTTVINGTGWPSDGLAFLLGLLSVQWTMTDYDATAHISEEVKKASVAAPAAIFIAVIGTGILGFFYNCVLIACSGDFDSLPGVSGYAAATIIANSIGNKGFYVCWIFVCWTAFAVVNTALQANARTFYAFSRDKGLPDRGFFSKLAPNKVPINGVWIVVFVSIVLCLLEFASNTAVEAIFALCAVALDTSYVIPIGLKLVFRDHPEVQFKPGPFNLGRGFKQYFFNLVAISWTSFVVIILSLPTVIPITAINMNYAAPITGAVLLLSGAFWFAGGRKIYHGPVCQINTEAIPHGANDLEKVSDDQ